MEELKVIMNEISENHMICSNCEKSHFGKQIYNNWVKDYVCEQCDFDINMSEL